MADYALDCHRSVDVLGRPLRDRYNQSHPRTKLDECHEVQPDYSRPVRRRLSVELAGV